MAVGASDSSCKQLFDMTTHNQQSIKFAATLSNAMDLGLCVSAMTWSHPPAQLLRACAALTAGQDSSCLITIHGFHSGTDRQSLECWALVRVSLGAAMGQRVRITYILDIKSCRGALISSFPDMYSVVLARHVGGLDIAKDCERLVCLLDSRWAGADMSSDTARILCSK
ncbi:hypothetical protein CDD82_1986 [Ophiocordyceps australis]|uniref:Uncharacterized protein n=1 Tax=Ophiocordyceps australis TaxID=1399860 RepID=A0A2C5Y5C9_9HYPO|nr:hypothetical protein CDD82_1986 [Ophiocordyceps australis]